MRRHSRGPCVVVCHLGYVVQRDELGRWRVPAELGGKAYLALDSALSRIEEHVRLSRPISDPTIG